MADRTFEELMAAKQAAGAPDRSFEELMAAKEPKREYTAGEIAGDVGLSASEGINTGAEFMADVLALPYNSLARQKEAYTQAFTGEGGNVFTRYWEGLKKEPEVPSDFEGGTAPIGDVTKQIFNPDELTRDRMDVPEGEGPAWLDPVKKGTKFATEALATAPLAGANYLKTALKAAPLVGLGGGAGQAVGGDTGASIGAITGALAGDPKAALDVLKLLYKGGMKPINWGKAKLFKSSGVDDAMETELRDGLTELVRNIYPDDPNKIAENVETLLPRLKEALARGEKGTAGQLLNDPGLLTMEKEAAHTGRLRDVDKINDALSADAMAPLDDIAAAGDASAAAAFPKTVAAERARDITEQAGAQATDTLMAGEGPLKQSRAAQEASQEAVGAFPDVVDTSAGLQKTVSQTGDTLKKQAGKAFDDIGEAAATGKLVRQSVDANFLKDKELFPDQTSIDMFKSTFPETFKRIASIADDADVHVNTLSDMMSLVNSEAQMLRNSSKTGVGLQKVEAFQDSILEAIDAAGGSSEARKKAAGIYREWAQRYGPKTKLGKAMVGDTAKFSETMLKPGAGNIDSFDAVVKGDRAARAAAESSLRARFKQQVIDPETGAINTAALKRFVGSKSGFGEHLKRFPAFKQEIDDALGTARKLEGDTAAMKEAESLANTIRKTGEKEAAGVAKSPTAVFGEAGDDAVAATKAANKIMKSSGKDRVPALTELVDSVKRNDTAFSNLRSTFMDDFVNTVSKDGRLTREGYKTFKRNRDVYEKAGLYTTEELDNIENALVEGQKMFLHADTKRLAKLPPVKRRVAETIAAIGGAKIGAQTMGSPLIGAALGRKAAVGWLDSITDQQAKKLAYEMSVNPQKFVDIVEKLGAGNIADAKMKAAFKEMLVRAGISTAVVTNEE